MAVVIEHRFYISRDTKPKNKMSFICNFICNVILQRLDEPNHRDKKQEGRTEHQNDVLNTNRSQGTETEKLNLRNTAKSNSN